jgi:hypothetical protein
MTLAQAPVLVGLPPLVSMFNSNGTAYAAGPTPKRGPQKPIESRFVFWFNGNGVPERYWMPTETGEDFHLPPCLTPLAAVREDVHVITGLDNSAGRGGTHQDSMSGIVMPLTPRGGSGGPSLDCIVGGKIGNESRFRSLQIGVSQESFGNSISRNMSWAAADRALPPEEIPHRLFDRLFGVQEEGWVNRKRSILDAVREDATALKKKLPKEDGQRVDDHLAGVRDLERAITHLPEHYQFKIESPDFEGDMRDWPRVAKLQSDLLAYAFATHQTRVASYMLTKCQGIARFPWLGFTAARHHDYTHADGLAPGADGAAGQRILRDICRWHVEEFVYLVAKLKSIPEGDGNLLDNTLLVSVHEHAEANGHKNTNCPIIIAGHLGRMKTGLHSRMQGTVGELYLTLADEVMGINLGPFASVSRKLSGITA